MIYWDLNLNTELDIDQIPYIQIWMLISFPTSGPGYSSYPTGFSNKNTIFHIQPQTVSVLEYLSNIV
jgi:hypothetical protein